jgi:hypothetical protein
LTLKKNTYGLNFRFYKSKVIAYILYRPGVDFIKQFRPEFTDITLKNIFLALKCKQMKEFHPPLSTVLGLYF